MTLIKSRRSLARVAPEFPGFMPMPMFEGLGARMQKLLDADFLAEAVAQPLGFLPATDVSETKDLVTLAIELPGLEKKDLDIDIEDGVLIVRGEKLEEKKDDDKKYHLVERTYGSFQRAFTLPRTVDTTKITAEFEKGVLKVLLPKTAESKAKSHKVDIAIK